MTAKSSLPLPQIGVLHTVGYAHPEGAQHLAHAMQGEQTLLMDIRYSPRSRWRPEWNRKALMTTYGQRYRWEQRLGNRNYQDHYAGIVLAEGHEQAVHEAASLLAQGISVVLLCACKNARTCHRSLVAKLIQDQIDQFREEGRI